MLGLLINILSISRYSFISFFSVNKIKGGVCFSVFLVGLGLVKILLPIYYIKGRFFLL